MDGVETVCFHRESEGGRVSSTENPFRLSVALLALLNICDEIFGTLVCATCLEIECKGFLEESLLLAVLKGYGRESTCHIRK